MKKLTASTPRRNQTNGHSNGHTPTNRVAPSRVAAKPSAKPSGELAELRTRLAILARSQAVAEFAPDGTLLAANENYLALFGYALLELTGQPHRKLLATADQTSTAYQQAWQTVGTGKSTAHEGRRVTKDGKELWVRSNFHAVANAVGLRPKCWSTSQI